MNRGMAGYGNGQARGIEGSSASFLCRIGQMNALKGRFYERMINSAYS